ncbi:hypothetical protein K488DRAFT_79728 [Vararia minispora EC-137]|uniref:Uncharacterized protein n=1 Tax=Vararia minispora EC-137 TaxID=1314806 RepID=A0ACB8QEI8_9AGAM|nr:hypothetical protein K488DRAFT_79728 [Vararia minispora EC-137]
MATKGNAPKSQYAPAAHVPLIKSPSLRVPRPVELPPDVHPLPDSIEEYFVYPFTLEPHILTLEQSRRQTVAAYAARRESLLRARADERERRRRDVLRRIAPGFEGGAGVLTPDRRGSRGPEQMVAQGSEGTIEGEAEKREGDVMDRLVDELARMDAER